MSIIIASNNIQRIGFVNITLDIVKDSESLDASMREIEQEYIRKIKLILDSQTFNE